MVLVARRAEPTAHREPGYLEVLPRGAGLGVDVLRARSAPGEPCEPCCRTTCSLLRCCPDPCHGSPWAAVQCYALGLEIRSCFLSYHAISRVWVEPMGAGGYLFECGAPEGSLRYSGDHTLSRCQGFQGEHMGGFGDLTQGLQFNRCFPPEVSPRESLYPSLLPPSLWGS